MPENKSLSRAKILVIEDEEAQLELIGYNLEALGFTVEKAQSGEQGLEMAIEILPDLIILDWMLPAISGIEVCRNLKAKKSTKKIPLIMLTARGEEADRIRGLETGADDYVVKPYSINELMARVRAMLRRTSPSRVGEILSHNNLLLNSSEHKVFRNEKPIKLGPVEFRLLAVLMENPKQVFTRSLLLDKVWGINCDYDYRTVDVHIARLRKSLKQKNMPNLIRTVRGTGYSLE
ncbi:MAG: phosphate regulon transcriptional regulator PhoB [Devosiaceae bacterium]|nr:phosphate regulon transcriptional regulator PhoB [Devosiaceae bacterium]